MGENGLLQPGIAMDDRLLGQQRAKTDDRCQQDDDEQQPEHHREFPLQVEPGVGDDFHHLLKDVGEDEGVHHLERRQQLAGEIAFPLMRHKAGEAQDEPRPLQKADLAYWHMPAPSLSIPLKMPSRAASCS